jgi:hypothetical protein
MFCTRESWSDPTGCCLSARCLIYPRCDTLTLHHPRAMSKYLCGNIEKESGRRPSCPFTMGLPCCLERNCVGTADVGWMFQAQSAEGRAPDYRREVASMPQESYDRAVLQTERRSEQQIRNAERIPGASRAHMACSGARTGGVNPGSEDDGGALAHLLHPLDIPAACAHLISHRSSG